LQEGARAEELAVLFNEARQIHLQEVVLPFLRKEKEGVAVLDRYVDSTIAYQGCEGGVPLKKLMNYHQQYTGSRDHPKGLYPDLTLILFFPQNNFAQTFTARRRWARQREEGRSQTDWDRAELWRQFQRQGYYLNRLPEFYRKMGIPRNFYCVDTSVHPHMVIKESIKALVPVLVPEEGRRGKEKELLGAFRGLYREGEWCELGRAWHEQQRWIQHQEGSHFSGKERR